MPPLFFKPERREVLGTFGKGRLERYTSSRPRPAASELRVLHVAGSPEDMGRQYGALVGDMIRRSADRLVGLFTAAGLPESVVHLFLDACWQRLRSHTPKRFLDEMAAMAAGARESGFDVSLCDIERIVTVTNLDLYKREERLPEFLGPDALASLGDDAKQALAALAEGQALSCTMFAVWGSRTMDGKLFALRNLDWVSQTGIHHERLVTVYAPEGRNAFVSFGYAGVPGCLAGMNEKGITLSEVGAFSAREELDGTPWVLTARQALEEASRLEDAIAIVQGAKRTIGYNYLVADGDPEHFGSDQFAPSAVAFETNFECCEAFFENDPKEREAVWTDAAGKEHYYGLPLKEAIMRADTAFGKQTRALQATDDGLGDPENTGNPHGRDFEGSTYTTCHVPMHDMIRAYETGAEYVFPVRNTKVIEAGAPTKIGPEEALNIAATVAHNTEMLDEDDWDIMSVVYGPTGLDFWISYESCDDAGGWLNAPDSGYWQFNLRELMGQDG